MEWNVQCGGGIGKTFSIYSHRAFNFCQRTLMYTDTEPSAANWIFMLKWIGYESSVNLWMFMKLFGKCVDLKWASSQYILSTFTWTIFIQNKSIWICTSKSTIYVWEWRIIECWSSLQLFRHKSISMPLKKRQGKKTIERINKTEKSN